MSRRRRDIENDIGLTTGEIDDLKGQLEEQHNLRDELITELAELTDDEWNG